MSGTLERHMGEFGSFDGRGVVITGASSGIGRLLALHVAKEGGRVALIARRRKLLEGVAEEIRALKSEAHVVECDLADADAAVEGARAAERHLGHVDVLVNNAGCGRHQLFLEQDLDDALRLLAVNVSGTLAFTKVLAPGMIDRGSGWISFVASIAGLVPVPGESVYSASKFAMVGFAEALSMELEPRGVHVSTICPGAVRTDFVPPDEAERIPPAARSSMIDPEVVVDAIVKSLKRGRRRAVVPRRLGVAVAMRGLAPSVVRSGTVRALRPVLEAERATDAVDRASVEGQGELS